MLVFYALFPPSLEPVVMTVATAAPSLRWYIVQARPGHEKIVAKTLRERIERFDLGAYFGEILVPSEEFVELRNGQKRKAERKFFPGYVMVEIQTDTEEGLPRISSEAWHVVKETNKVSGFIGGTAERPLPITQAEADRILNRVQKAANKPQPKVLFEKGELVRITQGPFSDFSGVVESMDADKGTLKVMVQVFGRATEVDFPVDHVERG